MHPNYDKIHRAINTHTNTHTERERDVLVAVRELLIVKWAVSVLCFIFFDIKIIAGIVWVDVDVSGKLVVVAALLQLKQQWTEEQKEGEKEDWGQLGKAELKKMRPWRRVDPTLSYENLLRRKYKITHSTLKLCVPASLPVFVCACVCVYFSHVACCTTKILVDRPVRSANRVQTDRTQFKRSEYFPSFLSFLFHLSLSLSLSLLWCKKQSVKNDIINCHFDEGREREERTRKMLKCCTWGVW